MADRVPDDGRTNSIADMGERLETQYRALRREVAVIQSNWQEYLELFGTYPHSAEALNQAGRRFLRTVQHEGWAACLLALASLTDSPKPGAGEDLTIQSLPLLIEDSQLKAKVEQLISIAIAATEFCRDWRQRYLIDPHASLPRKSLLELPRDSVKVDSALSAIVDVLDAAQELYIDARERSALRGTNKQSPGNSAPP